MFTRTVVALMILAPLLGPAAQAQRKNPPAARTQRKEPPKPVERPQPVASLHPVSEVKRVVKGDESPLLHLCMAPSGATVIEFPARDHYFGIHTSDIGDWVRIEKSPSRLTDNHIVLRPGKDLQESWTPALVQVQMRSGLLITLCIHPVKSAEQQTRRVVVLYDRDEIVASRQKAGLAVNIGQEAAEPQPAVTTAAAAPAPQPADDPQLSQKAPAPVPAADEPVETTTATLLSNALKDALKRATSNPQKEFKKWSSSANGLTVSTRTYDLNEETRIALVAIRNVDDEPLRILPGHPEIVIETLNDKGKVVQLSQVPKRLEETNAKTQMIPEGQTVYYAIAFAPPIMSTKQKLRVTVGQRAAADAPVAADITAKKRKEK
jgi:hypothetical protein